MPQTQTARQSQSHRPTPRAKKMNFDILRWDPWISGAEFKAPSPRCHQPAKQLSWEANDSSRPPALISLLDLLARWAPFPRHFQVNLLWLKAID